MVIRMCRAIIFRHHFLLRIIVMTAFYDTVILESRREMSGEITFQKSCCKSLVGARKNIVVVASHKRVKDEALARECLG